MAIDLDTVQGKGDGCNLFWIKYFSDPQIRLEYSEESSQLDIMVIQNGIMRVTL